MRADLHGQDHSETLDAARRAQNVGQECENDDEEEGEEEELVLLQARPVRTEVGVLWKGSTSGTPHARWNEGEVCSESSLLYGIEFKTANLFAQTQLPQT